MLFQRFRASNDLGYFLRDGRLPLLVELGIFFDVLIGVLIMGILIFRINKTFETIDTDMLKTLIG